MVIYRRFAAVTLFIAFLNPVYAADESFMSYAKACRRDEVPNSDYRDCRARKILQQILVITGKTGVQCNADRCLYKMASQDRSRGRWIGGGYTLSFLSRSESAAILAEETDDAAIVIRDPQKHSSVFKACGTCSDLVYVRGPLTRAAVVFVSPKIEILGVPTRHHNPWPHSDGR